MNAEHVTIAVEKYSTAMVRELHANEFKGDWLEIGQDAQELLYQIVYHAAKLAFALEKGNEQAIIEFAADVGNQALIAADNYRCLDVKSGGFDEYDGVLMEAHDRVDLQRASQEWVDAVFGGIRGTAASDSGHTARRGTGE